MISFAPLKPWSYLLPSSQLYTDKELFEMIASGNEAAFAVFFRRYDGKIFPFVCRMLKSPALAEEVVQEIFIKLWQNRAKLVDIEQPSAYIFTIASRHTLDHIKKILRERKKVQSLSVLVPAYTNSADEQVLFRETAALVEQAVAQLPTQQQKVFRLSRRDDMSYDEIALELNLSRNTVRNHLVEALRNIRRYLDDNGQAHLRLFASVIFLLKG